MAYSTTGPVESEKELQKRVDNLVTSVINIVLHVIRKLKLFQN